MEWLGNRFHLAILAEEWNPIQLSRRGPTLLHLFFANDLVIFSNANMFRCGLLKDFLDQSCDFSGHKVHARKTNIFFLSGVKNKLREEICGNLGFQQVQDLSCYLGVPLFH